MEVYPMLRFAIVLGTALLSITTFAEESASVRLSDSDVLFTAPDVAVAKMASCQPLKGQAVEILETQNVGGIQVAKVRIAEGACAGSVGWVGIARLQYERR
jgi:hypothetical protein